MSGAPARIAPATSAVNACSEKTSLAARRSSSRATDSAAACRHTGQIAATEGPTGDPFVSAMKISVRPTSSVNFGVRPAFWAAKSPPMEASDSSDDVGDDADRAGGPGTRAA